MSDETLVAELRRKAAPIWDAEYTHPFVQAIGDGSLAPERFRFYLCQDYVFLVQYCRVFALAAAKARDLATIALFGNLLNSTVTVEMQLHRDYCAQFGIVPDELERSTAAPVTHGYTRHLLTAAYSGSITEIVAAILPCQLGYAEIATRLARDGRTARGTMYAEWIKMYSSAEFVEGAETIVCLLNDLTRNLPTDDRARLEDLFLTSSRYEYLFWEMSWNQSEWPLQIMPRLRGADSPGS